MHRDAAQRLGDVVHALCFNGQSLHQQCACRPHDQFLLVLQCHGLRQPDASTIRATRRRCGVAGTQPGSRLGAGAPQRRGACDCLFRCVAGGGACRERCGIHHPSSARRPQEMGARHVDGRNIFRRFRRDRLFQQRCLATRHHRIRFERLAIAHVFDDRRLLRGARRALRRRGVVLQFIGCRYVLAIPGELAAAASISDPRQRDAGRSGRRHRVLQCNTQPLFRVDQSG